MTIRSYLDGRRKWLRDGKPKRGWYKWDATAGKLIRLDAEPKKKLHELILDEIPPTQCMVDGEFYTSRKKLHRANKGGGRYGTFEEVGDEPAEKWVGKKKETTYEEVHRDVEKAYNLVKNNMAPLSEYDRAQCQIINRQIRNNAAYGPNNRKFRDS